MSTIFQSRIYSWACKFLLIGCCTYMLFPEVICRAQTENREAIVMSKPGIIELPIGQDSSTVAQATINSTDVRNTLNYYQVEWIIKAFPDCNAADTIMTLSNGTVIRKLKQCLIYRLRVPDSTSVGPLADSLADLVRDVSFASGNFVPQYYGYVIPNDEFFRKQWGLRDSFPGDTIRADIRAPEAWEATTGSSAKKIGIIDVGIHSDHPDLSGKVGGKWRTPFITPVLDHATSVAGVAG